MPYDAKLIANYFLEKAKEEGKSLTPMQIQKLVYFAHGWHLALFGQPLIEEAVEAWVWGPVIPSLYREFKRFGDQVIEELATISQIKGTQLSVFHPSIGKIYNSVERDRMKQFLDRVWEVYAPFTAVQLSNMTHTENSPWQEALERSQGARSTVISNDLIQRYFESQKLDARTAER